MLVLIEPAGPWRVGKHGSYVPGSSAAAPRS